MTFKKAEMAKTFKNGLSMIKTNPLNHNWLDFVILSGLTLHQFQKKLLLSKYFYIYPYPSIRYVFTPTPFLGTYLHIHPYPLIRYTFKPTRLLDTHSTLPVYSFSWKIPTYPFISAYPFIKFDEKFQPTRLL